MEDAFRLFIMGPIVIERSNLPINGFESRKALALLCYLGLEDKPIARSQLADLFWGDKSEKMARNNLSRVLSNISSRIPGCIEANRQSVRFVNSPAFWLDTNTFKAFEEQDDVSSFESAVDLYRGEIMEGFYLDDCPDFDLWLLASRETWRQRVAEILRNLINYYTDKGNYRKGLAYASKLLVVEPWREEAHRFRMLLLAKSGQRSAALAQFEVCRRVLAEELGVTPTEETVALYEAILGGAYQKRHPVSIPYNRAVSAPTNDFIGRTHYLAMLNHRIGKPGFRLLTLSGIGGVGKTRLALQAMTEFTNHSLTPVILVAPGQNPETNTSLCGRIAEALDLQNIKEDQALIDELHAISRDQRTLLLIDAIDEFQDEQHVLIAMLRQIQNLQIVVTARSRLRIRGEWVLDINGLDYPQQVEDPRFEQYEAVQLFINTARSLSTDYVLEEDHREALIRICNCVAGLPLALELAAEWVRLLDLRDIACHVENDLEFLTSTMQDMPYQHCSLRTIFESTWSMLSGEEQETLEHLVIPSNGRTDRNLPAISADNLSVLASLADKSLVNRDNVGQYQVHPIFSFFIRKKANQN